MRAVGRSHTRRHEADPRGSFHEGGRMRESTILVAVDPAAGSEQPVLERAAWLATQGDARVELFACVYDPTIDSGRLDRAWIPEPGAREQLVARHRRALEE